MRVHLIDPGLINPIGHHLDFDARIAQELVARGHTVDIHCHNDFNPPSDGPAFGGTRLRPTFSINPYQYSLDPAYDRDPWAGSLIYTFRNAQRFENELRSVETDGLWLFPTLFAYQLKALAALAELPPVVGGIHNHPDFPLRMGRSLWRLAFLEAARHGQRIALGVFEQELLLEYEAMMPGQLSLEAWPIPHDGGSGEPPTDTPFRIGLLGMQRRNKGMSAIPSLIDALMARGHQVLLHDSAGRLTRAIAPRPGLQVVGLVPSIGDLITRCHAVLLNYDVDFYRFNGSGIAWEAAGSGIPLLAPRGTSISKLLRNLDTGLTFDGADPAHLLLQCDRMRQEWPFFRSQALRARQAYRARNGTPRFIDRILAHAG